jgi:HlyD family secretion protein
LPVFSARQECLASWFKSNVMSTMDERVTKPHLKNFESENGSDQLSERVRSLRLPNRPAESSGRRHWIAWVLCVLLSLSTAVLGYLHFFRPAPTISKPEQQTDAAKPISPSNPAAANSASSGGFALESKGYIITAHQILVSPQVGGMIVKLHIIESQHVKKDDVLAELEDTQYKAERDRAKANLALAKAHLARCITDHARAETLLPNKAISQSDYDLSLGNRNEAEATVKLAQAELDKAEWQLNNCVIRAPITGTILKKNAEEGTLVNPIAMQGFFSLCEMADLSDLEVDLTIQERDISRIFTGQKCKIRAEAFPDRVYEGYVSRLMPMADRAKGAIPVRVKVKVPAEEEGVYLKPEMGALVSFLNKQPESNGPGPAKVEAR